MVLPGWRRRRGKMTCRGSKCCWRCKRGLGKRNVMLFTANRSTECNSLFCKCVLVQCLTFTGDLIMCKSIYIRNYKEEIRNCKLYKMNTNCITTYLSQWGQHITICVFWQFWNAVCFLFTSNYEYKQKHTTGGVRRWTLNCLSSHMMWMKGSISYRSPAAASTILM